MTGFRTIIRVLLCAPALLFAQQAPVSVDSLVQRIDRRAKAYEEYRDYSVDAVSTSVQLDARWQPERTTRMERKIVRTNGIDHVDILKAVETENGKDTDVTAKVRKEAADQEKKAEEARAKKDSNGGEGQRGMRVSIDDTFPFDEKVRSDYAFSSASDTVADGRTLLRIRTQAKVKDSKRYEGIYGVDPETYDIRVVDVRPSKNPKFVKDMRLCFSLDVRDGKKMVVTRTWMRIYASLLVKKFRMEYEEWYTNHTFH